MLQPTSATLPAYGSDEYIAAMRALIEKCKKRGSRSCCATMSTPIRDRLAVEGADALPLHIPSTAQSA